MAFNVLHKFGSKVNADKRDDSVVVQAVHLTPSGRFNVDRKQVEIRGWVDSQNYTGPSKQAFVISDPDALEDLAMALNNAAQWVRNGGLDDRPASVVTPKAKAQKAKKKAKASS